MLKPREFRQGELKGRDAKQRALKLHFPSLKNNEPNYLPLHNVLKAKISRIPAFPLRSPQVPLGRAHQGLAHVSRRAAQQQHEPHPDCLMCSLLPTAPHLV